MYALPPKVNRADGVIRVSAIRVSDRKSLTSAGEDIMASMGSQMRANAQLTATPAGRVRPHPPNNAPHGFLYFS